MKTTHTAREWTKGTNTATKDWMTIYASGKPIAEVKPINKKGERQAGDFEREDANARLIAASPDLLEALQSCLNWAKNGNQEHLIVFEAAQAAINKATGN